MRVHGAAVQASHNLQAPKRTRCANSAGGGVHEAAQVLRLGNNASTIGTNVEMTWRTQSTANHTNGTLRGTVSVPSMSNKHRTCGSSGSLHTSKITTAAAAAAAAAALKGAPLHDFLGARALPTWVNPHGR